MAALQFYLKLGKQKKEQNRNDSLVVFGPKEQSIIS
jgi:hypothetical protein